MTVLKNAMIYDFRHVTVLSIDIVIKIRSFLTYKLKTLLTNVTS